MIFQMYENKGRHIAYTRQEAKLNEALGYVTVTKEQFYDIKRYPSVENLDNPVEVEKSAVETLNEDFELDQLKQTYQAMFGKPPHHAMKTAGIKKAIDGHSK